MRVLRHKKAHHSVLRRIKRKLKSGIVKAQDLDAACQAALQEPSSSAASSSSVNSSQSTSADTQLCGNGVKQGAEVCECGDDGICGTTDDLTYGTSCVSLGAITGSLVCSTDCLSFDVTQCTFSDNLLFIDSRLAEVCPPGAYSATNRDCSGNDGQNFSTIAAAVAAVKPGETIFIRDGVYEERDINISVSGHPSAPIVLSGYPGDPARPILQTVSNGTSARDILWFTTAGTSNWIIRNLTLRNANNGIRIGSAEDRLYDIRIEDLEMYNFAGAGIRAQYYGVERMIVQRVHIYNAHGT